MVRRASTVRVGVRSHRGAPSSRQSSSRASPVEGKSKIETPWKRFEVAFVSHHHFEFVHDLIANEGLHVSLKCTALLVTRHIFELTYLRSGPLFEAL